MSLKQLHDADMSVGYEGGWCLKYVQDAYHTDHLYPTAMSAWNAEPNKHTDRPPAGVTVPVYFSLGNVPAGHVAISLDDGWLASSSLAGVHSKPFFYKSLDDLIADYGKYNGGCTYLGYGEYVGSARVVEMQADNANDDQIRQAYQEILERPADDGGLTHYRNYPVDFIRQDLLNSPERQTLIANKQAQEAAARAAQEKADAQAKADAEAAIKAAIDAKARQDAIDKQKAAKPVVHHTQNTVNVKDYEQTKKRVAALEAIVKKIVEFLSKLFKEFKK